MSADRKAQMSTERQRVTRSEQPQKGTVSFCRGHWVSQKVTVPFWGLLLLLAPQVAWAETQLTEGQQDNVTSAFIVDGTIADVDVSGTAAIATSKLSGAVTSIALHGLGSLATKSAVASADITDGTIANADINTNANIATSKLSGPVTSIASHGLGSLATASAVASADITDGTIANADINTTANIATSKLSGAVTSIVSHGLGSLATASAVGSAEITNDTIANADINVNANIAQSKIANLTTDLAAKFGTAGGNVDGALNLRKTLWVDRLYESSNTHLTRSPHEIGGRSKGDFWVEAGTDALPVSLHYHSVLVYDGKMWVIGGHNGTAAVRKVYSSTDGITWTEAGTDALPVATRLHHPSLVYDGKMWVIGGDNGTAPVRKVYSSTNGSTWTEAGTDALPVATRQHSALVYDGKMWVIGGYDGTAAAVRKVYSSTNGSTWTEAGTNALPVATGNHPSLVYDGKMWVIGGEVPVDVPVRKVYHTVPTIRGGLVTAGDAAVTGLLAHRWQDPTTDAVLWMPFEDGTGTAAKDWTPYVNNGTLTNGPSWVAGKVGQALRFDGVDDEVTMADSASWAFGGGGFTITFWVYINAFPATGQRYGLISQGTDANTYMISYIHPNATLQIAVADDVSTISINLYTNAIALGWNHVTLLRDGNTFRNYINGVPHNTESNTSAYPDMTGIVYVGRAIGGGNDYRLTGLLDEVRIYNRALSAAEVHAIYEATK